MAQHVFQRRIADFAAPPCGEPIFCFARPKAIKRAIGFIEAAENVVHHAQPVGRRKLARARTGFWLSRSLQAPRDHGLIFAHRTLATHPASSNVGWVERREAQHVVAKRRWASR